jgi:hypothetical protein
MQLPLRLKHLNYLNNRGRYGFKCVLIILMVLVHIL